MDKFTAGVLGLGGSALVFVVLWGASSSLYQTTSIPVVAPPPAPVVEEEVVEEATAEVPAEDVVEAPAEEAPAEEVAEAPADEAPAEDVADAPAEEAPAEDVAEAPAEEAPAEDVAEAPAEEAPAEEVAEGAAEEAPAADDLAAIAAAGDARAGARVWRQCSACHVADQEQNRVGPHLVGIIGREKAAVDGFNYSDALTGLGGAWTAATMDAWLTDPAEYAPGNRMSFRGLSDAEDRANVLAYLADLQLQQ